MEQKRTLISFFCGSAEQKDVWWRHYAIPRHIVVFFYLSTRTATANSFLHHLIPSHFSKSRRSRNLGTPLKVKDIHNTNHSNPKLFNVFSTSGCPRKTRQHNVKPLLQEGRPQVPGGTSVWTLCLPVPSRYQHFWTLAPVSSTGGKRLQPLGIQQWGSLCNGIN